MIIARVRGTVVCTRKADGIAGAKYLLVEQCDQSGEGNGKNHEALDQVGAGPDEVIFMSQGSPNRQTERTFDRPVDATILGIIDLIEEMGEIAYRKYDP